MRKRILNSRGDEVEPAENAGLDLESVADVEVSSESVEYPIESALVGRRRRGWRAAAPGEQTIRLMFHEPVRLGRIRLRFNEEEQSRTQEFVLRWRPEGEKTFRDVVRQQYTFSPGGTTQELEDYRVDLNAAAALELHIVPDISGGNAFASLAEMTVSD